MAVYAVHWNKFHSRIFLSASADWTVKLWDHESRQVYQERESIMSVAK
jgi:hypothetical protein